MEVVEVWLLLKLEAATIAHLCLALGTILCSDDDNTVGRARTINGSGHTVLEHGDVFDVVGVEFAVFLTQLLPFELFSKKFCLNISELGFEIV